jgi:hypothetical protein
VDQILALLDATAPDPDLEPSLGSLENHGQFPWRRDASDQTRWTGGTRDDLEEEADSSDPSLGWTATIRQAGFGWAGGLDDAESEHDGGEPDSEREPWLGWCSSGALGASDDRELDEA